MTKLDVVEDQVELEPAQVDKPAVLRISAVLPEEADEFAVAEDRALHLHPAPENEIDLDMATRAVADFLDALGIDRSTDGLAATPARVARAYAEMLSSEPFHVTSFPNNEGYDELVVARAIPFASLCEHHLLPFSGLAYVGYLPDERFLGLSKLARVVDHFSRRLQVQERLTAQVANFIAETVQPKGVGVVLEAEHLCMSLRGVRAGGSKTVTSALKGLVRDDPRTRAEFLSLARARD
jgi:GTP cyclohydrolase I